MMKTVARQILFKTMIFIFTVSVLSCSSDSGTSSSPKATQKENPEEKIKTLVQQNSEATTALAQLGIYPYATVYYNIDNSQSVEWLQNASTLLDQVIDSTGELIEICTQSTQKSQCNNQTNNNLLAEYKRIKIYVQEKIVKLQKEFVDRKFEADKNAYFKTHQPTDEFVYSLQIPVVDRYYPLNFKSSHKPHTRKLLSVAPKLREIGVEKIKLSIASLEKHLQTRDERFDPLRDYVKKEIELLIALKINLNDPAFIERCFVLEPIVDAPSLIGQIQNALLSVNSENPMMAYEASNKLWEGRKQLTALREQFTNLYQAYQTRYGRDPILEDEADQLEEDYRKYVLAKWE